jgi:hypothetical protein
MFTLFIILLGLTAIGGIDGLVPLGMSLAWGLSALLALPAYAASGKR